MTISQLVLGTAQLGLPYGIANKNGQPDKDSAVKIIETAWGNGIRQFDTAQAYGQSEEVLGYCFSKLNINKEAKVISKFDPGLDHLSESDLFKSLDKSLNKLGVDKIFGMMLHNEDMLSLWDAGLSEIISKIKSSGKISNAGVSVYSPKKALQALSTEGLNFVQIPTNILDRRFESAGVYELANRLGKKIYIRSVYLQGLLVMDLNNVPEKMSFTLPVLKELDLLCKKLDLSRKEIALGYIKSQFPSAHVLFGAEKPDQVLENIELWGKLNPISVTLPSSLMNIDESILNPIKWPASK